jgi:hypothetical protein
VVVSCALFLLFIEEDLRLVRDRVRTTVTAWADSIAAVSFASSNVSYKRNYHQQSSGWYWNAGRDEVAAKRPSGFWGKIRTFSRSEKSPPESLFSFTEPESAAASCSWSAMAARGCGLL